MVSPRRPTAFVVGKGTTFYKGSPWGKTTCSNAWKRKCGRYIDFCSISERIYTVSRCCMSGHLRNLWCALHLSVHSSTSFEKLSMYYLWFLKWFYWITCQHGRCKSREIVTGFQWMISQAINKYKHRRSGAMIKQCSTREVTPKHHFSAVTISRLRNLLAVVKREPSPQYFNTWSTSISTARLKNTQKTC